MLKPRIQQYITLDGAEIYKKNITLYGQEFTLQAGTILYGDIQKSDIDLQDTKLRHKRKATLFG